MRTIILTCLLVISLSLFGQEDTFGINQGDTTTVQQTMDTANDYSKELRSKEWEERNLAGLNQLMAEQDKRRQKEKTRAFMRIGIVVLFLAVLIIGLRRRSKKRVS